MSQERLGVLLKALLVCGAVVALDQLTKGVVRETVVRGDTVEVLPFLDLANTRNRGVAFGLAGDVSPLTIAISLLFLVALLAFLSLRRGADPLVWLPAGLLVGGALGNLADRVRDEAVRDGVDHVRGQDPGRADPVCQDGAQGDPLVRAVPRIHHSASSWTHQNLT